MARALGLQLAPVPGRSPVALVMQLAPVLHGRSLDRALSFARGATAPRDKAAFVAVKYSHAVNSDPRVPRPATAIELARATRHGCDLPLYCEEVRLAGFHLQPNPRDRAVDR